MLLGVNMTKYRYVCIVFAIALLAAMMCGCAPKSNEGVTTTDGGKPLPPAATPNPAIPDKYQGMMPGGGPPGAAPGAGGK